ncbi:uncharacterized protein LOC142765100 [Rhipicephalus microplus]|uniref:uncharacterized protein LOC142765100 n=1 Tax=Rhipicephalus microplus TaxID=6941 RepID=UPI003F6AB40D
MKAALLIISLVVCSIIITEAELAHKKKILRYRAGRRGAGLRSISPNRIMRKLKNWRDRPSTKNKAGKLTSSTTKKGLAKKKQLGKNDKVKVISDATNNLAKQNTQEQAGAVKEKKTSVTEAPSQGMVPAGGYGADMGMMGHGMMMDPMMGGGMGMGMGGMASGSKLMTGLLGTMLASQVAGTLATTGSGIATTILSAQINQNSGSATSSASLGSETSGNNAGSSGTGMDNAATSGEKNANSGKKKNKPVKESTNDGSSKSAEPADKGTGGDSGNSKDGKNSTISTASSTTQKPSGGASLGGHSNRGINADAPSEKSDGGASLGGHSNRGIEAVVSSDKSR